MNTLIALTVCLLGLAGLFAPWWFSRPPGRHFFLSGDAPGLVRFLGGQIELTEGAKTSWVTVTRTGTFTDPRYGKFDITRRMLEQMVENFDRRVLGQDVFFDVAHRPSDGAAAKVLKLAIEGSRLRALVEWTDFGTEAVKKRGFAYLSAEFHETWRDNEKGAEHGCVLLGAGLTTRPVIKNLDPVQLSQSDTEDEAKLAIHPNLIKSLESETMNKHLIALKTKLLSLGLTEEQIKPILAAAQKQLEALADDEAKSLAVVETFTSAGESLSTQLKTLSASGAQPGNITLQVGQGLDAAAVQREVARLLAEQANAAAADQAALAGKVKLLSDTITGDKTLSDDAKATLIADASPLVTKELSDEQVRGMAAMLLGQAQKVSAAVQLATMGYRPPSGSLHISVDSSNEVKSLQEQIDRRLGLDKLPPAERFARTGGTLLAQNKAFAERCLAEFDAQHGHVLHAEHKMLAAGNGQISDIAVPSVFERTVLREALYQLVGLNFVNVGTAAMAPTIQIPYSYRDTSAAGTGALRVYEQQAIQRAGVIQTYDEARPIPQKLAFKLTDEMRYLLQAAPIDFEPVAENTRNIIRIVSEDTDRLIQNEVMRSADEFGVAALNDTLTAQVNGTNKVFVCSQFPIVRPRRVFDLKGVQQGSTLNPLTVTLNAVARSEYVAGVTLAAGLYYVMDYNLGELRFVNEAGVLQAPTNGWALTVVGSYTTNAAKFNIDVGVSPDTVNDVYDRGLTLLGGRKVVIENDRYYTASMMLMSGAVDNAFGQAKTFSANSSRPGTGLNPDGSVATIKGMPAFNTRAPGLDTGDTRIVIGERGNTRFRMVKPWSMRDGMQAVRDSNGFFVGAEENYGDQFIVCHTPQMRRNANTTVVLYSATGRVARAS
ncbi:MAG: hypothetical protein C0423_19790 [Methylibium sp.]|nr:hypothetical protein [Methylibium sp.]